MKRWLILWCGLTCAATGGCGPGVKKEAGAPVAFTSIVPHKDIAERIAGGRFEVHALVGPGRSPHEYSPTAAQMAKLSEARIFFRTGAEFEQVIVPKIERMMPSLAVVDLRTGIALRDMEEEHGGAHEGHEKHGAGDPHIWLSPVLMKAQAETIAEAFVKADPEGESLYRANLQTVLDALDSLNGSLHELLNPFRGSVLFVYHASFGYFAAEYGLVQKAVETGGKEPGAKALVRCIDEVRAQGARVIFVQPQFSQKSARAVAAQTGCVVVPVDPLPRDYFTEMRRIGVAAEAGLRR
jgi:zinc transport system substrate-binding protein